MKSLNSATLVALTSCASALSLLLTGCGTTSGYKHADKTGNSIAEYRDEIVNGKNAVDATMKSLSNVAASANTDPRKPFEQYSKDVKNLESTAAKVAKRAQSMREQGQAYFKQWQTELAQVTNPEIRSLAEQRKAKLEETFASIRKFSEPLKAEFEPWMSDLKDLQKYLSQDLTIAGVDAAKDLFSKALAGGQAVQKSLDGLVAELNTIAATLTPSKVEPK